MNRYPGLARSLNEDEVKEFRASADEIFRSAEDRLEVNALWHPEVVRRLGELLIEWANSLPTVAEEQAVVHVFASTAEAYDASQTGYIPAGEDRPIQIKDGDVLYIPSEEVVGVMVEAWPVAVKVVSADVGAFHELNPTLEWSTFENGRYHQAALRAADLVLMK